MIDEERGIWVSLHKSKVKLEPKWLYQAYGAYLSAQREIQLADMTRMNRVLEIDSLGAIYCLIEVSTEEIDSLSFFTSWWMGQLQEREGEPKRPLYALWKASQQGH